MLADLTQTYADLSPLAHAAVAYGLVLVGAILGGVLFRATEFTLSRARYVLWLFLFGLGLTANQVWWIVYEPAVQAAMIDRLSLPIFDMASYLAGGACLTHLAIARSRDAYGHGRHAILAFLPFVNFALLVIPSRPR